MASRKDILAKIKALLSKTVANGCTESEAPAFEQITFCGLEGDAIFAEWLTDMLADFVARETAAFLQRTFRTGMPRVRRLETRGFTAGCCERISARLDDLAEARKRPTGRGLVVAKNAMIERFLADNGIELQRARGRSQSLDRKSYQAGETAGDKARFERPIGDTAAPLMIER